MTNEAVDEALYWPVYDAVDSAMGAAIDPIVYAAAHRAVDWVWHQVFRAAHGAPHPELMHYLAVPG